VPIRELTAADAQWAAELMEQRRQQYEAYSPVFWRPATGITGLHARFLSRQITEGSNAALRTDHGFIICQRRAGEGFVDDFAVSTPQAWASEGAELLIAAAQLLALSGDVVPMRVVTAHADEPKVAMLRELSLTLVEQWWVKPVLPAPAAHPGRPSAGRVTGTGFDGFIGPAPPVYNPGGPVLQVERIDDDADLAVIEAEAGRMEVVLAVFGAAPGTARRDDLGRLGWTVASDWYLGSPGLSVPGSTVGGPGTPA
jgi:hypothetical protein